MRAPILAAAMALIPVAVLASGPGESHGGGTAYLANGTMTYELFEATIEHVDLDACPSEFDPDAVFCRMTLASENAHVFVFAYDDAQPLLAVKSYDLGDGFLPF